jgi:hypothetical protein
MDLLSGYSGLARLDTSGVLWRFHCDAKETSFSKLLYKIKDDQTVGSKVTNLLSRYSCLVLRVARQDTVSVE